MKHRGTEHFAQEVQLVGSGGSNPAGLVQEYMALYARRHVQELFITALFCAHSVTMHSYQYYGCFPQLL